MRKDEDKPFVTGPFFSHYQLRLSSICRMTAYNVCLIKFQANVREPGSNPSGYWSWWPAVQRCLHLESQWYSLLANGLGVEYFIWRLEKLISNLLVEYPRRLISLAKPFPLDLILLMILSVQIWRPTRRLICGSLGEYIWTCLGWCWCWCWCSEAFLQCWCLWYMRERL